LSLTESGSAGVLSIGADPLTAMRVSRPQSLGASPGYAERILHEATGQGIHLSVVSTSQSLMPLAVTPVTAPGAGAVGGRSVGGHL
jgi:hypothetical protein